MVLAAAVHRCRHNSQTELPMKGATQNTSSQSYTSKPPFKRGVAAKRLPLTQEC